MKKLVMTSMICASLFSFNAVHASDSAKHFKGVPSETYEQAVANLKEYNPKLAKLMANPQLTPADMAEIHQLTYTLENALERIKAQLKDTAELLEDVHQASEKAQYDKALNQGRAYLEQSAVFLH